MGRLWALADWLSFRHVNEALWKRGKENHAIVFAECRMCCVDFGAWEIIAIKLFVQTGT
jgi:hypothetical protein